MKTIFKNKGKTTLYILFAIAVLLFAALLFCSQLLPQSIFLLALTLTLMGMVFLGGLLIQMRSSPPW